MSETADLLKDIRQKGLTQSDIYRRTGIPQPRISKWERGSVPASADDALRLKKLRDEVVGNAKALAESGADGHRVAALGRTLRAISTDKQDRPSRGKNDRPRADAA